MKTKIYKSVEEWLATKPSKPVIEKVLSAINKWGITEARAELREKTLKSNRIAKMIEQMKKLDLPITKELLDTQKLVQKDIDELSKMIPPSPYGKKKEEVK